ncbi:MAG: chromosomal replication initiator protein DnaA [Erysipelothrix sp.]|nr:chromosomal replication initiator protein DnaA [Erysipelothrix sp.]
MNTLEVILDNYWNKTLNSIRENVDDSVFTFFYEKTRLESLDDNIATIVVPTMVIREVISGEKEMILDSLSQHVDQIEDIKFLLPNEFEQEPEKIIYTIDPNINESQTFDNFVVGPSNKESHSAALASAYSPGKLYNPLFIYGNSGLGKTHLLNAIGNYVLKNEPHLQILYIQCSDFVDRVVTSIRNQQIAEFKIEMAQLDVLLIDDIQFLAGKEKSHEVFFQLFNELVNNKKQIVITSDRHPTEINGLEDRLISRFGSGLSVSVNSPAFDTALAILKQKLKNQSFDCALIDEEVLGYIATNFSKDIRILEGALNRLLFYTIDLGQNDIINLDTAISAFRGQQTSKDTAELTASKIKRVVADYYGLTKSQLVSKTRTKYITTARHIAIFLCRRHLDMPFAKIGDEFGKRDHSTVMASCDKVDKLLKTDTLFQQAVGEIEKTLVFK